MELQKQKYGRHVVVVGFPSLWFARDVVCAVVETMFGREWTCTDRGKEE
jgi:hypothetical protein